MPYTDDPANSEIDRIRLKVGDTDVNDEGLSDAVYQYIIDKNTVDSVLNEGAACIEALTALVSKYANFVTEKAGGLFIKESERYEQYKQLLDMFSSDPRTALIRAGVGYTGGISKEDSCIVYEDDDKLHSPFRLDSLGDQKGQTFNPLSFRGR